MSGPLATVFSHSLVEAGVRILALAVLAALVTGLAAYVFRVRVRDTLPEGATLILGLGVVAIYLNTRLVLVQFVSDTGDPLATGEALRNVAALLAAGFASYLGRAAGDRAGRSERLGWRHLQPDFSPLVRATGRYITVELPGEIADIEGYDPVPAETKAAIAGQRLDFPRGLTVAEVESELAERLTSGYDVGYVDVETAADGSVEYLAVGKRPAGIGPTLPPTAAAVALRADPPFSATSGDTVQIWEADAEDATRVGTGELRASAGTVATIATAASVAHRIDPTREYRLLTLPADSHPEREFAAMLRRAEETMSSVTVTADSPLVGSSVSAIALTVIAVRDEDGAVETLPRSDRAIRAGDVLFAIGRPEALRKLEATPGTETDEVDPDVDQAEGWEFADRDSTDGNSTN